MTDIYKRTLIEFFNHLARHGNVSPDVVLAMLEAPEAMDIGPVLLGRIFEAAPFSDLNDLYKVQGVGTQTVEALVNTVRRYDEERRSAHILSHLLQLVDCADQESHVPDNDILLQMGCTDFNLSFLPGPDGKWSPIYPIGPFREDYGPLEKIPLGTPGRSDGPFIPATTPVHPNTMMILYHHPKYGAVDLLEYVNGWCGILWIIRTDKGKGGASAADTLPKTDRLMSKPSQKLIDDFAPKMASANGILYQNKCGVAIRLCEVIVLDARRIYWTPGGKKQRLSDVFSGNKAVFDDKGGGFMDTFEKIVINGYAEPENRGGARIAAGQVMGEFQKKIRKPCVHLFLVKDVQDKKKPDTAARMVTGVGGQIQVGARKNGTNVPTPYAVIESGASESTIAHEVGHALSLPHAEDEKDDRIKNDPKNLMRATPTGTNLHKSQCDRMKAFLKKKVAVACPRK